MGTVRIETRGADGRMVSVFKITDSIDASNLAGRAALQGLARYVLQDGGAVNVRGDDFEVVATGETLQRA